ncbi:hypothetical protein, partial [Oceanivirga salmonicida]|uniref:hypothetical protein n=1 Tax=Oceanivirga salmonicida TaxID=1769291 RepID=UPI0012E2C7EA
MIESIKGFFFILVGFIAFLLPPSCYSNHNSKADKKMIIKEYKEQKNIIINEDDISVHYYSSIEFPEAASYVVEHNKPKKLKTNYFKIDYESQWKEDDLKLDIHYVSEKEYII